MESPRSKAAVRFKKRWILPVLFIGLCMFPATVAMLRTKWEISHALANAKSIRIEHYHEYLSEKGSNGDMIRVEQQEQIFASKTLTLEDVAKLEEVFPICPDIGLPPGVETLCLFNPHHRIIITDEKGSVTTIQVCFECDHVSVAYGAERSGRPIGTPLVWAIKLRRFFAAAGMPNSPALYRNNYIDNPQIESASATGK